jgi:hypothetical protein
LLAASPRNAAHAEDWARWRGPRQDGISREKGLLTAWPAEGPKQIWQVPLSGGFSAVAVADGRLFTQTKEKNHEVVPCLDARTCKRLWRYTYDCDYGAHPTFTGSGMPASRTGPRATPVVDGDGRGPPALPARSTSASALRPPGSSSGSARVLRPVWDPRGIDAAGFSASLFGPRRTGMLARLADR